MSICDVRGDLKEGANTLIGPSRTARQRRVEGIGCCRGGGVDVWRVSNKK